MKHWMAPTRGTRRAPAQKRAPLTHFLCLPLVNTASQSHLEESLNTFRKDVVVHLPAKAIRPVGALHCTLGVMSLSQTTLTAAIKLLQDLPITELLHKDSRPASGSAETGPTSGTAKPLNIQLAGLESMHDPDNTSILYVAPQDPTERLHQFCLSVQAAFKQKDLLVQDDRPLKLHATIVNTIYAKGFTPARRSQAATPSMDCENNITTIENDQESSTAERSSGHGPKAKSFIRIDARDILDKYKDYSWAENITLDRLSICEMGAKKKYDDQGRLISEEYKEVAHIALPK